jgi:hypothetical protein
LKTILGIKAWNSKGSAGSPHSYLGLMVSLLVGVRLIQLMTLPQEGLLGYGDMPNYIQLAKLSGWPFINYWVEFPPIFPFINSIFYKLVNDQGRIYYSIFFLFITLVDTVNLFLFCKLVNRISGREENSWRIISYLVILIGLPYTWWYFDEITVLCLLLALYFLLEDKDTLTGIFIAVGALVKLFPLLLLVLPWRYFSRIRAIKISILSIGLFGLVYGCLLIISPTYTKASINSMIHKGSWETVWALIDQNYQTGNYGPYSERYLPDAAVQQTRNPAVVNPIVTLFFFTGIGFFLFLKKKVSGQRQSIAFLGFTFSLFFLWSQGWSPQWILLLIPIILLTFPINQGLLFTGVLIFVNLLEWPVLLSRGLFNQMWVTIILRTIVIFLLGIGWYQISTSTIHSIEGNSQVE